MAKKKPKAATPPPVDYEAPKKVKKNRKVVIEEGTWTVFLLHRKASSGNRNCDHVLDIGIGCGTFINRLRIPAYGYDINPVAVSWLKEREIYCNPYENIPGEVDGLTLWDVLEHIPNPDDLLDLVPSGMHVITSIPIFPDLQKLQESKHYKKNEHYLYFSENGLYIYMEDMGFRLQEKSYQETKIGRESIMTFVFQKGH